MELAMFGGAIAIAIALYIGLSGIALSISRITVEVVFQNGTTAVVRKD